MSRSRSSGHPPAAAGPAWSGQWSDLSSLPSPSLSPGLSKGQPGRSTAATPAIQGQASTASSQLSPSLSASVRRIGSVPAPKLGRSESQGCAIDPSAETCTVTIDPPSEYARRYASIGVGSRTPATSSQPSALVATSLTNVAPDAFAGSPGYRRASSTIAAA